MSTLVGRHLFEFGGKPLTGRIGLGAMRLTGPNLWGPYPDHEAGIRFLRGALEAGVPLIDTADAYGPHTNEELIREALHPFRDDLVIATKGGFVRGAPDFQSFHAIGAANYLRQAARLSARRLGVERIDLYYLHSGRAVDAPFAEQIETLAGLRREGVIDGIGLSNVTVEQFEEASAITEIAAVTAHYNVVDRSNEALLRAAERAGAMFSPWQPLSMLPPADDTTDLDGPAHVRSVLEPIARAHDASTSQIVLAWLLQVSPVIVPVPGTTDISHLLDNLAAARIALTTDEVKRIDLLGHPA